MGAAKSASVLRQLSGSSRAMNKRLAIFQHNPVRRGDNRDFTAPARVSLAAFPIGSCRDAFQSVAISSDVDEILSGNSHDHTFLTSSCLAEELFKKAADLAPGDPQWPDQLGQLYSRQSQKDAAAKALAACEKAQAAEHEDIFKFYRLDKLAKAAFKAEEIEKASRYANESLTAAARFPKDWNHGNAIHHGNNVLGRIALKQGDLKLAAELLLKAGKTPGSPSSTHSVPT